MKKNILFLCFSFLSLSQVVASDCYDSFADKSITENKQNEKELSWNHFNSYLLKIQKQYPPLSQSENSALIKEFIKTQDIEVRNKILSHNLGLVVKAIHKYKWATLKYNLDIMDLLQEGNIALIKAISNYKPDQSQFSTYAMSYILGNIKTFILKSSHILKVNNNPKNSSIFWKLEKQEQLFFSQEKPFDSSLMAKNISNEKKKINSKSVEKVRNHLQNTVSFNSSYIHKETSKNLVEENLDFYKNLNFEEVYIPQQLTFKPEEITMIIKDLQQKVSLLDQTSKDIFRARFLMNMTLQQIGNSHQLSREGVRQRILKIEKSFRYPSRSPFIFNMFKERLPLKTDVPLVEFPQTTKRPLTELYLRRSSADNIKKLGAYLEIVNFYTESMFNKPLIEYFTPKELKKQKQEGVLLGQPGKEKQEGNLLSQANNEKQEGVLLGQPGKEKQEGNLLSQANNEKQEGILLGQPSKEKQEDNLLSQANNEKQEDILLGQSNKEKQSATLITQSNKQKQSTSVVNKTNTKNKNVINFEEVREIAQKVGIKITEERQKVLGEKENNNILHVPIKNLTLINGNAEELELRFQEAVSQSKDLESRSKKLEQLAKEILERTKQATSKEEGLYN